MCYRQLTLVDGRSFNRRETGFSIGMHLWCCQERCLSAFASSVISSDLTPWQVCGPPPLTSKNNEVELICHLCFCICPTSFKSLLGRIGLELCEWCALSCLPPLSTWSAPCSNPRACDGCAPGVCQLWILNNAPLWFSRGDCALVSCPVFRCVSHDIWGLEAACTRASRCAVKRIPKDTKQKAWNSDIVCPCLSHNILHFSSQRLVPQHGTGLPPAAVWWISWTKAAVSCRCHSRKVGPGARVRASGTEPAWISVPSCHQRFGSRNAQSRVSSRALPANFGPELPGWVADCST